MSDELVDSLVEEMRRVGTERLQAEPWNDPAHYLNVVARISREDGARMVRCADRIEAQAALLRDAGEVLKPFAEFARASGFDLVPDEMPMTQGSRMARRQVTAGDFRRARTFLEREARVPWSETTATAYLEENVRLAEHVEGIALAKLKDAEARADRLASEVERLREALEQVVNSHNNTWVSTDHSKAIAAARAALHGE